jgi:hypothetical protein
MQTIVVVALAIEIGVHLKLGVTGLPAAMVSVPVALSN